MSFLKTFITILGLVLGLVGGPIGKAIGLGLTLIFGSGLGRRRGGGLDNSPTYGFDSLQNPTRAGGPPYLIYGQHLCAPYIVSINTMQEGNGQILYLLCLVGEGEVEEIGDVRLNDTPISSFTGTGAGGATIGASYETRLGTSGQTAVAGFNQIGVAYDAGTKLDQGATHVHEMRAAANEIVFNFIWPSGLYGVGSEGDTYFIGGEVQVFYKPYGAADSAYTAWTTYIPPWEPRNGGLHVWGGESQSTVRQQMRIQFNAAERYTFKIVGNASDETGKVRAPTLASVIEVTNDTRTYPNRALLAIKCPASAQLQGGIPRVTCVVKGRKVYNPSTGLTAWTRNPVWILRDLLLNTRYGLGRWIDSGDLDDGVGGSWRDVATVCDSITSVPGGASEARHEFDMVLDTKAPAREWIDQILRTCRATLFASGGKLKLARHGAGASVRSFSEDEGDGIRKGILATVEGDGVERSTLVERYLDDGERWTVARFSFTDRSASYKRQTITIRDQRIALVSPWIFGTSFPIGYTVKGWNSASTPVYAVVTRTAVPGDTYLYFTQREGDLPFGAWSGSSYPIEIASGGFAQAYSVALASPEYLTPERALETQILGVTRKTQAIREARYHLSLAAFCPRFVTFEVFLGDLDLEPGDHIALTSTRLGYSAKQFTVLSITLRPDGRAQIEAREYDANVFTDSIDLVPSLSVRDANGVAVSQPAQPAPVTTIKPVPVASGATNVKAVAVKEVNGP